MLGEVVYNRCPVIPSKHQTASSSPSLANPVTRVPAPTAPGPTAVPSMAPREDLLYI